VNLVSWVPKRNDVVNGRASSVAIHPQHQRLSPAQLANVSITHRNLLHRDAVNTWQALSLGSRGVSLRRAYSAVCNGVVFRLACSAAELAAASRYKTAATLLACPMLFQCTAFVCADNLFRCSYFFAKE
jgi:hypothetical protein